MEEKFGLIRGVKCQFKKTDQEVIDVISAKTGIKPEDIRDMMLYNMFTVGQFSKLSGLTVSVVHNKTRPVLVDGNYTTELNFCFPFSEPDNEGPKFIIRDSKSDNFLK